MPLFVLQLANVTRATCTLNGWANLMSRLIAGCPVLPSSGLLLSTACFSLHLVLLSSVVVLCTFQAVARSRPAVGICTGEGVYEGNLALPVNDTFALQTFPT